MPGAPTYPLSAASGRESGAKAPRPRSHRPGGVQGCRRALFAACFSLAPSLALALDIAQASAEVCLNADPRNHDIVRSLSALGWEAVPATELTDQDLQAIAINLVVDQLGPREERPWQWEGTWARIKATAAGKRRLLSIESAPTQRYFLRHPRGHGLIEIGTILFVRASSVHCSITVSSALSPDMLAPIVARQIDEDKPPVTYIPPKQVGTEQHEKSYSIIIYNPSRVPDLIGEDLHFIGNIRTFNRNLKGKSQ